MVYTPNDERLGQMGGQPILIMSEDTERQKGKDALSMNIQAGKVVGETFRTTLGPKGMKKMLGDNIGDIVITNDGATILNEMDVEHPAAKMIVEVSESQDESAGDGTTTAVALSGELLKKAEDLLDQDRNASVITKGYRMASMKAEKILEDISMSVEPDDLETLKKIARTSITGKSAETAKEHLSDLTIGAIKKVMAREKMINIDLDNIKWKRNKEEA